jgi:hypothetical protein
VGGVTVGRLKPASRRTPPPNDAVGHRATPGRRVDAATAAFLLGDLNLCHDDAANDRVAAKATAALALKDFKMCMEGPLKVVL